MRRTTTLSEQNDEAAIAMSRSQIINDNSKVENEKPPFAFPMNGRQPPASLLLPPKVGGGGARTFEDILHVIKPCGAWHFYVVGSCLLIIVFESVASYGQPLLMIGKMDYTCYQYEDGTFGNNSIDAAAACESPTTGAACTTWNYSSPYYESTMVSTWDLVCSRSYLRSLYQSIMLLGYLIGLAVFGSISDAIGRARVIQLVLPFVVMGYVATTFAHEFWVALLARGLYGFWNGGFWKASFVLVMEIMVPERRSFASTIMCLGFPGGGMIVALMGWYGVRSWRTLQGIATVIALFGLPLAMFLPESPRWLVTHQKYERAQAILSRAARWHSRQLPADLNLKQLHDLHGSDDEKFRSPFTRLAALFSTSQLRRRTLILCVQWFVIAHVFYGATFYGVGVLPGNPYVTLILMCALRLASFPVQISAFKYFGHRQALVGWLWVTALSLGLLGLTSNSAAYIGSENVRNAISIILVALGATGGDCCFSAIYIITGELYPTISRQTGLSMCSMFGRVGAFCAPFVANMVGDFYRPLPAYIFCLMCMLSSIPVFMLPRTEHAVLPDTIEDTTATTHTAMIAGGEPQHDEYFDDVEQHQPTAQQQQYRKTSRAI